MCLLSNLTTCYNLYLSPQVSTQADLNLMAISSNPGYLTKMQVQQSALPTMDVYDGVGSGYEDLAPVPVYQEIMNSSFKPNNTAHTP